MNRLALVGGIVLALALQPASAHAQWGFKIGGGVGIQTGDGSQFLSDGWNGQLGGAFKLPGKPMALTLEFNNAWANFNSAMEQQFGIPGGHQNIWSITGNIMLTPTRKQYYKGFNYYLIGGGGFFSRYAAIEGGTVTVPCYPGYWYYPCSGTVVLASQTDNGGGVNGGAGIGYNLGAGMLYVEARYYYAWLTGIDAAYVPVVFGFRFGW